MRSISFSLVWVSAMYSLWEFSAYSLRRRDVSVSQAELKSIVFVNMADLAFLEAKIVCGGARGNDKMVGGLFSEVVGRRCSALLVLRREGGWGF